MAHDREWTARDLEAIGVFLWDAFRMLVNDEDHHKSYDPLTIIEEENLAYSYVFDLDDGGRCHQFTDLQDLYEQLLREAQSMADEWKRNQ